MKKRTWGLASAKIGVFALAGSTFVVLAFALYRTFSWKPDWGDASVWFSVYEWMSQGSTLYSEVFDHKDFGFLYLNYLIYKVLGVMGPYLLAFSMVVVIGLAIYRVLRTRTSPNAAWALSLAFITMYVGFQSYLATYTEHLSMSLFILGFTLLTTKRVLSGVAFGLAFTVKVSTGPLFVLIFAVSLAYALVQRRPLISFLKPWLYVLVGFLSSLALMVFWAFQIGAFEGWVEAIQYNGIYAELRRGGHTWVYALWVTTALAGISPIGALFVLVSILSLWVALVRDKGLSESPPWWDEQRLQILAMVFGAGVLLVFQFPASSHHLQFLAGPVMLFAADAVGTTHSRDIIFNRPSWLIAALLVAIMAFSVASTAIHGRQPLMPWQVGEIRTPLQPHTTDSLFPRASTVAIFGGNSPTLDPRVITPKINLVCRHIYQFAHLVSTYGQEYVKCLEMEPDVIFWDSKHFRAGDASFGGIPELLESLLEDKYVLCGRADPYRIYVRSTGLCTLG